MIMDTIDLQPHGSLEADVSGISKSSAWLLAEGAFAMPHRPAAVAAALVTVRKSRVPFLSTPPPAPLNEGASATSPQEGKGARVFRIETATGEVDADPQPQSPSPPAAEGPGPMFPMSSLKKRISVDKRPGPVLRIVVPPIEPAAELDQIHLASSGMSKAELTALVRMLAELDPILDGIQRARMFQFIDEPEV